MKSFSRFLNEDYSFRLGGSSKKGFEQTKDKKKNLIDATEEYAERLAAFGNEFAKFVNEIHFNPTQTGDYPDIDFYFAFMNSELKKPFAYFEITDNGTYYMYNETVTNAIMGDGDILDPFNDDDKASNIFYPTAYCLFNKNGSNDINDLDIYYHNYTDGEYVEAANSKSIKNDLLTKGFNYEQNKIYANLTVNFNYDPFYKNNQNSQQNNEVKLATISSDSTFSIKIFTFYKDEDMDDEYEKAWEIVSTAAKYTFKNSRGELKIDLYRLPDFEKLARDFMKNCEEIKAKFDD